MNLQIESLIKAEVLCNLKTTNEVYLEMCLLQLFRCSDLDGMIKILVDIPCLLNLHFIILLKVVNI
ncbi:hypothetical protein A0H76_2021 [Hepatospora eriocheir]|uniref:Uncharacterized protein n=1 Tax=Hepatospora eriocheir TaxID=1081669 RepID=A0A1X0QGC1_9MICR|nr:hypothetical protein A0H76_2021 [Hepatospora eriocheir]